MGKRQYVWWWRWSSFYIPLRFPGPYPNGSANCGAIYRNRIRFGPLEIRWWGDMKTVGHPCPEEGHRG